MEKEFDTCPSCGKKIKSSTFSSVRIITDGRKEFINQLLNKDKEAYCSSCYPKLKIEAHQEYNKATNELTGYIEKNIESIPILSTHTPYKWEYDALGIVTGQSVTGTGVMSEFKSGFTDLFGGQSGSFNKKLAQGEKLCFAQLRAKTMEMGGNAIIAADLDYGDVGEGKGMLMVCSTGTAVKVKNKEVLGDAVEVIKKMDEAMEKLNWYNSFKKYVFAPE